MRLYQNFVEGNAEEINATKETLKFLGFYQEQHHPAAPPENGSPGQPTEGRGWGRWATPHLWDKHNAEIFLKALNDEYPTHKKVFSALYKAGRISYEDLQKKAGMTSAQLKSSLASLTKVARRDGNPDRRAVNWVEGTYSVWEVDPGLRKVIEEHNLLP